MKLRAFSVLSILLILPLGSCSVDKGVVESLVRFIDKLEGVDWGWNLSSDPCSDQWFGITCDSTAQSVKKIVLKGMNLSGVLDFESLCSVKSITVLSLDNNNVGGSISEGISGCRHLTHLYLGSNKVSGKLPEGISRLSNLKRLDISGNNFSGNLPDLARISGMVSFLAQDNHLQGGIPEFDFPNFDEFNVSNNNLSGPVPDVQGLFGVTSFSGNPGLCGIPLPNPCPLGPPPEPKHRKSLNRFLVYSGYVILGMIITLLISFQLLRKSKTKLESIPEDLKLGSTREYSSSKNTKSGSRSEYSVTSVESGMASSGSSLVVLNSPLVDRDLRFEDLLRAPAELLGRGKHGSLYKVVFGDGLVLAVKRIQDWRFSREEFSSRMDKIDRVKHPNVLPVVGFYCSKQEKLLVYEYQSGGSLFALLHGNRNGEALDWGSRLSIATSIAEALAATHESLLLDQIAHGNLKSTNILFDRDMNLYISEYGLMLVEDQDPSFTSENNPFCVDIFGFGVILLELLTGKTVQNNGCDLARWVRSVVQEEWTVEVFDQALTSEFASEERMVNLLQVALKCVDPLAEERPSMSRVAAMVNKIREEEERSMLLFEA